MYDAYKRGLLTPREVYDIKRNDSSQYRILTAFAMRAIDDEVKMIELSYGSIGNKI